MREVYFIIDRIEGEIVVAEDDKGNMCEINVCNIESSFKEGDILVKCNEKYHVDEELTNKRKKEIEDMMKDMWKTR